jgi:hypothetical protein
MKAKFEIDQIGRVTLSYDSEDWDGETIRVTREFTCPPDGGYVRERRDGDWKQVCDKLAAMGSTLMCSSREKLAELIRREYRAMRRAEKREAAQF